MSQPPFSLLHVVRRYGPVGGMERYVFELTQALAARGQAVTVLCERCYAQPSSGVTVHAIGEVRPKPRWVASLRFRARVGRWVADQVRQNSSVQNSWLIHSHERTTVHHVTSFHGPPFATVRDRRCGSGCRCASSPSCIRNGASSTWRAPSCRCRPS